MLRRFLAYRPGEVSRFYRLYSMLLMGALVMDLLTCLWRALLGLVFSGIPVCLGGSGLDHQYAVLDAWRNKVSTDLCARKGFRDGPVLDVPGTLQLLNSGHVWER